MCDDLPANAAPLEKNDYHVSPQRLTKRDIPEGPEDELIFVQSVS